MRTVLAAVAAVSTLTLGVAAPGAAAPRTTFTRTVLATGLADPYEIVWGPDSQLWVTEKSGLKVTRVDPATGTKTTALDLAGTAYHQAGGSQDGLLGLAFGSGYAYLSYSYLTKTPAAVTGETLRLKIVRYTVDAATHTLISPADVLTGLPSGTDHQSGRLRVGPDRKLYYTIGDQGANQFANACDPNWAQRLPTLAEVRAGDWSSYVGKTLRLNPDGSIPADNPRLGGVRSHVITYGHRNPQGMDFTGDGRLYEAEQGPKTDDEINIVHRGSNYGWPYVAGKRDDSAYVYSNWSAAPGCKTLAYDELVAPAAVPTQQESAWTGTLDAPISTLGTTVGNDYDFRDPASKCAPSEDWFICNPTIAPSSLTYYRGVRGWGSALLVTSLKDGAVHRLVLSVDGRSVVKQERLWVSRNRYRDTALSPDGTTVYVATDSTGMVRGPDGTPTDVLTDPGAILAFRVGA
ncbi:hypothetical protein GCM10010435_48710 [Winogradskya consettensis]|uniref:Glucose/Sorbosone dehydrogenase domain-containing protein n=1 Tax=Winogradskya consettensis TaxID=113560 RepID=A0A919SLF4_9ACTN|nr:hypothetical protein Aco04nite_33640 [Actinoplanes consettensis]